MAASEPQQFGEFAVIEKLGQGAMGAVYKARQTSLNRIVALKLLPAHYAGNADFLMRFKNEAMAAAALNHPHIVQVYAAGEDNGTHFFAMEFVEGESLGGRMERKGCIEPREAIAVACHLAQALDYAWKEAKVIHRDIKPDNIFLSKNGMVKLGDLGLAKLLGNESSVTQTGAAMGTPYYVSPEQAMGKKEIDFRADIYSLGCTIFHAMTGQPPYRGESAMAVMMMHISQPPPKIQEVWPQCPPPIIGLLDRMLRKRPEERHESYEALLQQLYWVAARLEENAPEVDAAAASLIVPMPAPQTGSTPDASRKSAPKGTAAKTAPPSGGRGKMLAILGVVAATVVALLAWQPWKKAASPAPAAAAQTEKPAPQLPATEKPVSPTPPPNTEPATVATNTDTPPAATTPKMDAPATTVVTTSSVTPATATKDMPFVNSLGMKFVPVPITGGSTGGQQVLFSVWETRVQDYEAFAKEAKREWKKPDYEQGPTHPAANVNWEDAETFCNWLTQRERQAGLLSVDERYRLPTDHEWSSAVGIGEREDAALSPKENNSRIPAVFPWGNTWPPPSGSGNYSGEEAKGHDSKNGWEMLLGYRDGFVETAPVGSFAANRHGLYDLGGNVWEWCGDSYDGADEKHRGLRGGSFQRGTSDSLLSSKRLRAPSLHSSDIGYRIVLAHSKTSAVLKPGSPAGIAIATKNAPFVNTLGMKFVPVPITGGPTDKQRVLFSVWETRVQDYEAFAKESKREWSMPPYEQGPTHPAVMVSWEDAHAFCTWLTERERKAGNLSATERYRLPSDHEWSCAVGIGDREDATKTAIEKHIQIENIYPWGTGFPPPSGAGNYNGEEAVGRNFSNQFKALTGYRDAFPAMAPVGRFAENRFGLFDLGGNAWEMCEDTISPVKSDRVIRGASFLNSPARELSSAWRSDVSPKTHSRDKGFRCVLDADGPANTTASKPTATAPASSPAATPKPQSETEKWLAQMDALYLPMYQRDVTALFESGMAELKKAYLVSLDREGASASRAAKLNDALAFRHERQRIEADSGVPPNDLDTPPAALKSLRAAYRTQSARLEADRRKHSTTVFEQYDKVLATSQNALTQRQRLDEALLLQQRREVLANEWGNPASVTARKPAASPDGNPAAATNEKPFVNSLGMKFVPVPDTNVLFCIHITRKADYAAYAAAEPGVDDSWKTRPKDEKGIPLNQSDDYPVVAVCWNDAKAFCDWLSRKEGRAYRLPTDREWSHAVGIGDLEKENATPESLSSKIKNVYPWGAEWPPPKGAGNFADVSLAALSPNPLCFSGYNDGYPSTSPVFAFKPNKLGIHDMAGNIGQFCEDFYDAKHTRRVQRGSDYLKGNESRDWMLSSHRFGFAPTERLAGDIGFSGFRCVLDMGTPAK